MATLSARFSLKRATQVAHDQLESLDCHARLFSPDYSLGEYQELLAAYCRVLTPYDNWLCHIETSALAVDASCDAHYFDALYEVPYVSRRSALLADLTAIAQRTGREVGSLSGQPLSIPQPKQPAAQADGAYWGIRYVLEGMSLGGKAILAQAPLFRRANLEDCTDFFAMDSRPWPAFCRQLERVLVTDQAQTQAESAANALLKHMISELDALSFPAVPHRP